MVSVLLSSLNKYLVSIDVAFFEHLSHITSERPTSSPTEKDDILVYSITSLEAFSHLDPAFPLISNPIVETT